MANDELAALRAEARRRHTAATKKASRLRRHNEVEITGTKYDPRRSPDKLKHYTRSQLVAYTRDLNAFLSRDVQYLRGARGTVITKKYWDEYTKAQHLVSKRNKEEFAKIGDIFIPRYNMTIQQRIEMLAKPSRMGNNLAANRPFDEISKSARGLVGDKGARAQAEAMIKRLSQDWLPRKMRAEMDSFYKMASIINEPSLSDAVSKLSLKQFTVLWGYTGFASAVSMHYENMKKVLQGADEPWHMATSSDAIEESHALIEWVKSLNLGS